MPTASESGAGGLTEAQGVSGGEILAALAGGALTLVSLFVSFVSLWQRGWWWWSLGITLALAPAVLGLAGVLWGRQHPSKRSARLLRATGQGLAVTWGVMLVLVVVMVTYNVTRGGHLH